MGVAMKHLLIHMIPDVSLNMIDIYYVRCLLPIIMGPIMLLCRYGNFSVANLKSFLILRTKNYLR